MLYQIMLIASLIYEHTRRTDLLFVKSVRNVLLKELWDESVNCGFFLEEVYLSRYVSSNTECFLRD